MPIRALKAVQQNYKPNEVILRLLDQFRLIVNECIRVGLKENITSLKALSLRTYGTLAVYDVPSYYKLCAISAATGILRNHRKTLHKGREQTIPYARKPNLTTCYGFKIADGQLLLPLKPRSHATIPLNQHTLNAISGYEIRSVTLTPQKLSITFAKSIEEVKPTGLTGIDRNLNNVTVASSCGEVHQIDLTRATEIKHMYRNVKSKFRRNDARIRRKISKKYGLKQRARVQQILHHASKLIVMDAKRKRYGIVMESLTGLGKMYRKGNRQDADHRFRLSSWSYGEFQRQVEYKARWEGLPVIYVRPHGTSARCSICGSRMARIPEESRMVRCTGCGLTIDRDVNAARNILARGVRFAPVGLPSEAMVREPDERAEARKVILKVDGSQPAIRNEPSS